MLFFFLMIRRPPSPPLFPYTPLFRPAGELARLAPRGRVRCDTRRDEVAHRVADEELVVVRDTVRDFVASDRKSTRLNSSHLVISYAVFCLKKKTDFDHFATVSNAACA